MLSHMGRRDVSQKIKNALLCTLEEGIHTSDVFQDGLSKHLATCTEFTDALIARLDDEPKYLKMRSRSGSYAPSVDSPKFNLPQTPRQFPQPSKALVGVDIFVDWEESDRDAEVLAKQLVVPLGEMGLDLQMISNRGVKVWPNGNPATYKVNHWRCRIMGNKPGDISNAKIAATMRAIDDVGLDVIKTENLYFYDGKAGFSLGQGQ